MLIHSKKAWGELCGLPTKDISVYKSRGKLVYTGDFIDDSIPLNKVFLEKWSEKKALKETSLKKEEDLNEGIIEYPAEKKLIALMEQLNEEKPEGLIEKIKNEASFTILSLFSTLNTWTKGSFDQEWLIEKSKVWCDGIVESIDNIKKQS